MEESVDLMGSGQKVKNRIVLHQQRILRTKVESVHLLLRNVGSLPLWAVFGTFLLVGGFPAAGSKKSEYR